MWLRFLFLIFLAAQAGFHSYSYQHLPKLGIVPPVPSKQGLGVYALGDNQLLFRALALRLQQAGDTFGRVTALYKYDYPALEQWFYAMDSLDNQSNLMPTLASYYFAQSQNSAHAHYIVNYLEQHTKGRAEARWWWVIQGAYLAKHKLKDTTRAIALAERLKDARHIPLWARQYPAFLYEQTGQFDDALQIIENIVETQEDLSDEELSFMQYFVRERLEKLEEAETLSNR